MSIVRVGLAENKNYAEGYEAIFGKKKKKAGEPTTTAPTKAKRVNPTTKAKTAAKPKPAVVKKTAVTTARKSATKKS